MPVLYYYIITVCGFELDSMQIFFTCLILSYPDTVLSAFFGYITKKKKKKDKVKQTKIGNQYEKISIYQIDILLSVINVYINVPKGSVTMLKKKNKFMLMII